VYPILINSLNPVLSLYALAMGGELGRNRGTDSRFLDSGSVLGLFSKWNFHSQRDLRLEEGVQVVD
jgi:hypothetical protein